MNTEEFEDISKKLDTIILLLKIQNRETMDKYQKEVKKDITSKRVLEVADGSLRQSDLLKTVAKDVGVAEITVKRKIRTLKEMGFLVSKRKGNETYYETSDLF